MSDSSTSDPEYDLPSPDVTVGDVRRAITDRAELNDGVTVAEVVTDVGQRFDVREQDVKAELDRLERNGFVYLVGDGSRAEVRVP